MINRGVIQTSSQNRWKRRRHGRQGWQERQGKEQATAVDETQTRGAEEARQSPGQEARSRNRVKPIRGRGGWVLVERTSKSHLQRLLAGRSSATRRNPS